MANRVKNPYELFLELQPTYREIELRPQKFGNPLCGAEHVFYFYPRFIAAQDLCIHTTYYRGDGDNGNFIQFDVKEGNFAFDFRFDPSSEVSINRQFDAAAGAALLAGPMSSNLYIAADDVALRQSLLQNRDIEVPIKLSWKEDKLIPGLKKPAKLVAVSWRFFFPSESLEADAIAFAIEFARAKQTLASKHFRQWRAESKQARDKSLRTYQTALKRLPNRAA
jgi:hypothetical protein